MIAAPGREAGSGRGGGKQPIMITIKSTITIRKEGDPLLGAWTRNTVTNPGFIDDCELGPVTSPVTRPSQE